MTEKDAIITVYPSGTRGKITRKRRLRTVYIVIHEDYEITDHIYTLTTIPEVFDTKIKAQDYIKQQHFPEEYYILPRKLK